MYSLNKQIIVPIPRSIINNSICFESRYLLSIRLGLFSRVVRLIRHGKSDRASFCLFLLALFVLSPDLLQDVFGCFFEFMILIVEDLILEFSVNEENSYYDGVRHRHDAYTEYNDKDESVQGNVHASTSCGCERASCVFNDADSIIPQPTDKLLCYGHRLSDEPRYLLFLHIVSANNPITYETAGGLSCGSLSVLL